MSTDTSAEAVERLARILEASECCVAVGGAGSTPPRVNCCGECPRVPAATLRALLAERDAARADAERLAWLEAHPECEVSHDGWNDPPKWRVHQVIGGRNDRVWTLVGEGETAREAISAARAAFAVTENPAND